MSEKVSHLRKKAFDLGLDHHGGREELEKRLKMHTTTATITVVNKTKFDCKQSLWLRYQTASMAKNSSFCSTGFGVVLANSSTTTQLPLQDKPFFSFADGPSKEEPIEPIINYELELSEQGLCWSKESGPLLQRPGFGEGRQQLIMVKPGGVYEIVVDEANGPLSQEEKNEISDVLFDMLENGTPFNSIWPSIVSAVPHISGSRSPKDLMKAYDGGGHQFLERSWKKRYVPLKVVPGVFEKGALPSGSWRACLYWRALDRFPGGNADCHTVMYRISSDGGVDAFQYSNWDGSHDRCKFSPSLHSSELARVLAQWNGPMDSECTLIDHSSDSDEYDTEWSSQEILVFVPPKWTREQHNLFPDVIKREIRTFLLVNQRLGKLLGKDLQQYLFQFLVWGRSSWLPVFRLHQKSVHGEEWRTFGRSDIVPEKHVPANKKQAALLDGVRNFVGMGRVNTFSDAGDGEVPCRAAKEREKAKPERDSGDYQWHLPYLHPVYFKHLH